MRRMNLVALASTVALGVLAGFALPASAQVTVFEGARLIVGNESAPIENATQTPCRKTAGRLMSRGSAVLACPLSESAKPTPSRPTNAKARETRGGFAATLNSPANRAITAAIAVRP